MFLLGLFLPLLMADGEVHGLVFDERGELVDEIRLELPPGEHALTVGGERVTVQVADGMVTEVLVGPGGVQIEQPVSKEVEVAEAVEISGVVLDEDGRPIVGARIIARGGGETVTDADGRYTMLAAEPHVSVIKTGFTTYTGSHQETVELVPAGIELASFTISAPRIEGGTSALLEERRNADTVNEVLGAEQMKRNGDSDAAAALTRVTGLTLVGGKYVYVRGLGDRYSVTLLNGSSLPSPEPEKRVVPLDMFPATMLESITIQKTPSPDRPGDFGGGTVELTTRGAPSEPTLKIGVGGAYVTGETGQKGYIGDVGPTDWLGIDNGYRALPEIVQNASDTSPLEEGDMFSDSGYSPDELEAFGESIANRWWVDEKITPPQADLKIEGGMPVGPGGFMLGGIYKNSWDLDQYTERFPGGGDAHRYDFTDLGNTISLGGMGTAEVDLGENHHLQLTSALMRITDQQTRIYSGYNYDVGGDLALGRIRWLERQLWFNQAQGSHDIGMVNIAWRGALSQANRVEPDRREWRTDLEENTDDTWRLSDRPEGNGILYSELLDVTKDVGVDVSLAHDRGTVKVGGSVMRKDRAVDTRRFKYMHKGELSRDTAVLNGPSDKWFTPETIGSDGFQFEEITRQTDNYFANHALEGLYGMATVPVGPVKVMGGVRWEHSKQTVTTFELFNPDSEPVEATLETRDWLPSANATYAFGPDMQLRAAYGRTVSRPDFRELSPATFNDVTGGRQTFGNPDLTRARLHNVDLRWEWYPSAGESLSLGFFYKRFEDPIEVVVVPSAQLSVSWANAEAANNQGVELEWRKDLPKDFWTAGNVSLIRSRVVMPTGQGVINSSSERPLQGQSPWVLNLQAGYSHPERGSNVTLLYNAFGPRIAEAGAYSDGDVYELPRHRLDLVASQQLRGGLSMGIKAQNILRSPAVRKQADLVLREVQDGVKVSASLSYSF